MTGAMGPLPLDKERERRHNAPCGQCSGGMARASKEMAFDHGADDAAAHG